MLFLKLTVTFFAVSRFKFSRFPFLVLLFLVLLIFASALVRFFSNHRMNCTKVITFIVPFVAMPSVFSLFLLLIHLSMSRKFSSFLLLVPLALIVLIQNIYVAVCC